MFARTVMRALTWPGVAALVAACAAPPPSTRPDAVLTPNANLLVQGIAPIPMSLVERVEKYTDFRGHSFVEWHPTDNAMLVAHRKAGDNVARIFRLDRPLGELQQLTEGDEPVTAASWEPRQGRYIVYERSQGGNEADQLYRLDLATRQSTLLTDPDEAHSIVGWVRDRSQLLHTSVPLDRTAQGRSRERIDTALWLVDPEQPAATRRKIADLPGPGWFGGSVSDDGRSVAMTRYLSASESQVWTIDLASGQRKQVLPAANETLKATHFDAAFSKDGRRLFVISDRAGEFRELMALDLASASLTRISAHIPWDVSGGALSDDGRWFVVQVNVDGRDELRIFDATTLQQVAAPGTPPGAIGRMAFHRQRHRLAYSINTTKGPNQLYVLDPASGSSVQWTRAQAPAGVDTTTFADQQVVRWTSFDGLRISGIVTRPPPRFTGKRPVLVSIHGGPEAQAQMGFLGRWNYFVQELGVTVIEPNVRGSAGYGKTFLTLDNGLKREDAVKDIGALLDWIAQQPDLDATRVLVTGGSYGGYMTLATSVHYSDRIVGGIPIVGPSNFVTFLTHTESYRRDLRRVEYGDERDPATRAWMEKTAPLNNTERIRKPLFVVQGKNDPRVPYTESEQIVQKVRGHGTPVWYLRGENEGHGFARKDNADFLFYAMVRFVEERLLPKQ
jgi:dipeptidyl aminopeptidase/acylaminoacyl peptidase